MADDLAGWARERAPALRARAEAEAVAALRDALVAAALSEERVRARTPAPPPPPEPAGEGIWVYGILRGDAPPLPAGVAKKPVERVNGAGLTALVSRVPLAEFGAEPLRRNLNDLAWLEEVARAQEAVLDAALADATVVPLRMCTIFERDQRVLDML